MPSPPDCRSVGPQCRSLPVTLQVARLENGDPASGDHEATWLLGHTQRIQFGDLQQEGPALFVAATLNIPCRHATISGAIVTCRAHGLTGVVPDAQTAPEPRWKGPGEAMLVSGGELAAVRVDEAAPKPSSLPVFQANPCETAGCRTADNRVGAACCRDLQLTILCAAHDVLFESLVRARKPPLLCKVEREGPAALGVEVISACGYLNERNVCSLHGLTRQDGRTAKPDLCFDWPEDDAYYHPGCAFNPTNSAKSLSLNNLQTSSTRSTTRVVVT